MSDSLYLAWRYLKHHGVTTVVLVASLALIIYLPVLQGPFDTFALSVPRGTALTTLQGGTIQVFPIRFLGTAVLVDQDPNDVNPFLIPSKLDIQASNGIAHGISFVLRPADL